MGSVPRDLLLVKAILLLCILTNSFLFNEAKTTLSKDDYLSMKRHLKSMNKPAVKSIEIDNRNIFDCVHINKQPAFDHPLLKNHTVQMKPSSHPRRKDDKISSSSVLDIGLPGEGCPVGTVPIRRATMDDLMSAPSLSQFGKKYAVINDSQVIKASVLRALNHHYATLQANGRQFYGTGATMNLWKPHVGYDQFSLAQFWLTSGPYDQLNSIEAGWIVQPSLFNDNYAHLFAYWTADGYHRTGCYNHKCPGFVQVSRKIPLGARFTPRSTYDGKQYQITLLAFLDIITKNWWLKYENELIGYWPNKLFNSLSRKAENVHWGGEVFASDEFYSPPMGSGHFAEEGYGKASYMKRLQVITRDNRLQDAPDNTRPVVDVPQCYNINDKGRLSGDWRRTFYFGGPGGKCIS
ncbi:hypothetical protein H6P81_020995 [Aristolochia fimbriata]|uniref:Neprosin PEP catalytic domain-containing protein n=1 Tax=Aristolochia fimbriata TaxID=158543 RepID=A0AAV7DXR9_ARIFI|nr:hypothetical protein H6P81_020995 [Aristolochia fimbriata]